MPLSPRTPAQNFRTHRKMVSEGKLIDFDHVAAGHEGVQSTATGELIFKPCTKSEVDFYESAVAHPAFHKYIPVHFGALTLRNNVPNLPSFSNGASTSSTPVPHAPIPEETRIMTSVLTPEMSRNIMPLMAPPAADGWTPSGGKRINSGLLIALENVAFGCKRPNILDVKLGARLWADDAPPAKRAKLDSVAKETTSLPLGFRIAGMKIWKDPNVIEAEDRTVLADLEGKTMDKDGYRCYNKNYGRAFNAETVKTGFETYFYGLSGIKRSRSKAIIERMIVDLRDVERTLQAEESRMYSSSILMVYEGDPEELEVALELEEKRLAEQSQSSIGTNAPADESEEDDFDEDEDEDEDQGPKVYDVRLIDFAHAGWTPGQGPDQNVLHGIRSVVEILEDLHMSTL